MEESYYVAKLKLLQSLRTGVENAVRCFNDSELFIKMAKNLCEQYNKEYSEINKILGAEEYRGLQYVNPPWNDEPKEWFSLLLCKLLPQIDEGIGGLESKISPLPAKSILELRALKEEFEELLKNLPPLYEINVTEAIKECEKGDFLGSALISCRMIQYILDQISGKDINEKIESLKKQGLIEPKGEIPSEYIIKADKKARNYLSHNLTALASCSEALELLGICKRLLKLLKEYQKNIKTY
jgi:predicted DNA-binding ArsR family transcriptional regulator